MIVVLLKMNSVINAMRLLCLVLLVGVVQCGSRTKRLTDIVCNPGTTEVIPPNYFVYNSPGWCGSAVEQMSNDVGNLAYREECQRWLGGDLPDKVDKVQLEYCYEFPNATILYRMGLCCMGTTTDVRCFTGDSQSTTGWNPFYYEGHMSYIINYENSLTTCGVDELCQTKHTYTGSLGNIQTITLSKGCVPKTECESAAANNSHLCTYCQVDQPTCTQCCSTPFCNYQFTSQGYNRPAVCPVYPCSSNPCQNRGVCHNQGTTSFTCKCRIHWNGTVCSQPRYVCPFSNPCLNGGTCYDYSDMTAGDYRCDCPLPYVGKHCEIAGNLTCDTSAVMGAISGERRITTGDCTILNDRSFGHPEEYGGIRTHFVTHWCKVPTGHEAAYKINFEVKTCSRGDYYTWATYHSCCELRTTCTSSPCLNGGTCYDWSDVGPGEYRCHCVPPFVGNNCELPSQLPCDSTYPTYTVGAGYNWYSYSLPSYECTPRSVYSFNKPWLYYRNDPIFYRCVYDVRRPSDGHQFIQGSDGQIKPDHIQFEVESCERGEVYSWVNYHMCCPTCLSSPCQNDGYCVQTSYADYVCKCRYGFGGIHCEEKQDICVMTGDPHYRTYDDTTYSYQGTCKYVLSKTCSNAIDLPQFTIYARNEHRVYNIQSDAVSYPRYVEIEYNNHTVLLSRFPTATSQQLPVKLLVDDHPEQIPYTDPGNDFSVVNDGDLVTFYNTLNTVQVKIDGDWVAQVLLVKGYNGSLCGLCGDDNSDRANDLTKPDGTIVVDPVEFADSWIVPDDDLTGSPEDQLCPATDNGGNGGGNGGSGGNNGNGNGRRRRAATPVCEPLQEYRDRCSIIKDVNGVFSNCIGSLSPGMAEQYYANCLMDACFTSGVSICKSIRVFSNECRRVGQQIPCTTWKPVSGCADSDLCPVGMTYQCMAPACRPTCANPDAQDLCILPNSDGCVCADGEFLLDGQCVSECPAGCVYQPTQHFIKMNESYSGMNCTTVFCDECESCNDGEPALRVVEGCLDDQQCVNDRCSPVTAPPHDNGKHCGWNDNCNHGTNKPTNPPGQDKATKQPGNENGNGGGKNN